MFITFIMSKCITGQENELLLMAVLDCLFNSVSGILRKNVDKKSLCDNMEVVMLAMDEMIDNGMIMESDPQQVKQVTSVQKQTLHQILYFAGYIKSSSEIG